MTEDRLPHRLTVVWFTDLVGYSSLMAQDEDRAIALVRRFQAAVSGQPSPATAQLGRVDEAFEYLDHLLASRAWNAPQVLTQPFLAPLRSDPRFAEIRRKLGLA